VRPRLAALGPTARSHGCYLGRRGGFAVGADRALALLDTLFVGDATAELSGIMWRVAILRKVVIRDRSRIGVNPANLTPFQPLPGSDLVLLLAAWCEAKLPTVNTGQPFLQPPATGVPCDNAPGYERLLRDRDAVFLKLSWTAHSGAFDYAPADLSTRYVKGERIKGRIERWRDDQGPWHPGRHPTVCLDASLMKRIVGLNYKTIGE
jgi:hypothetical protein